MGNNPPNFVDPMGDIFKISNKEENVEQEKADIRQLAISGDGIDNSKYIKFSDDGVVSLDFGDMSQANKEALLKSDIGLALIYDLSIAKDEDGNDLTIMYNAGEKYEFIQDGRRKKVSGGVFSLSKTPKNIDGGLEKDKDGLTRPKGIDGLVYIHPAKFYPIYSDKPIRRSSIVYHELRENWFRTVIGLPYRRPSTNPDYQIERFGFYCGMDGAHNRSVLMEGQYYNNRNPGGFSRMEEIKRK